MKFPVFRWQKPQPHKRDVPTSVKASHGDPSTSEEMTPEEESSWPLGPLPPCHRWTQRRQHL
uniref:Ubiquitin conjugating enzyme E2 E2 n=1 Tax=Rousettus aegyptiacus TaxID=9407 RepID=A0A7J8HXP8_ROUAE|nr:ubiquitin conjugating enzyme E2 E2 [Rousettus aegyptiacus]